MIKILFHTFKTFKNNFGLTPHLHLKRIGDIVKKVMVYLKKVIMKIEIKVQVRNILGEIGKDSNLNKEIVKELVSPT